MEVKYDDLTSNIVHLCHIRNISRLCMHTLKDMK